VVVVVATALSGGVAKSGDFVAGDVSGGGHWFGVTLPFYSVGGVVEKWVGGAMSLHQIISEQLDSSL
jgi:hypothetical protein